MTLWRTKEDMREFVESGAYGKYLGDISKVASSFTTTTMDSYNLIPWKEAKSIIQKEETRRKAS